MCFKWANFNDVTKLFQVKPPANRQSVQQFPVHQRTLLRPVTSLMEEECYVTDHERRGICLIIENDAFQPNLQLSGRRGSEVDLKAANDCFTTLGFEVRKEIFLMTSRHSFRVFLRMLCGTGVAYFRL